MSVVFEASFRGSGRRRWCRKELVAETERVAAALMYGKSILMTPSVAESYGFGNLINVIGLFTAAISFI